MKNKTIKLNISHLIMGAIILLMLWLLFKPSNIDLSKYDKHNQQIDSLNIELKHIRNKQDILGSQIRRYKDSIDVSNARIDSLSKELTSTRIYYGKKIKDISSYTSSELYKFFTERYN
jgi:predicted  nucleic acid-binding Zn-ribbon protein